MDFFKFVVVLVMVVKGLLFFYNFGDKVDFDFFIWILYNGIWWVSFVI